MSSDKETAGGSDQDVAETTPSLAINPSPEGGKLDETYRKEFENLHDILCRLKHSRLLPEEAQESLQNAFVILSERHARTGFWPDDARSWLIRVAVIQARRQSRRSLVSLDASDPSRPAFSAPLSVALRNPQEKGPSTVLLEEEKFTLTREALQLLPEESRRIVEAHVLEGNSFAAVAEAAGLSEENAKKICQRALLQIRSRLGRYSSSLVPWASANTYKPRTRKGILEAIHTLPRNYSEMLEARYDSGLSMGQCAALKGLSGRAAEERLRRAEELMERKYGISPEEIVALLGRVA
jgi:RNA polymerase sigma factor (sigma-70 family)